MNSQRGFADIAAQWALVRYAVLSDCGDPVTTMIHSSTPVTDCYRGSMFEGREYGHTSETAFTAPAGFADILISAPVQLQADRGRFERIAEAMAATGTPGARWRAKTCAPISRGASRSLGPGFKGFRRPAGLLLPWDEVTTLGKSHKVVFEDAPRGMLASQSLHLVDEEVAVIPARASDITGELSRNVDMHVAAFGTVHDTS